MKDERKTTKPSIEEVYNFLIKRGYGSRGARTIGIMADFVQHWQEQQEPAPQPYTKQDMRAMYNMSCGCTDMHHLSDQTGNNERFEVFLKCIEPTPKEQQPTIEDYKIAHDLLKEELYRTKERASKLFDLLTLEKEKGEQHKAKVDALLQKWEEKHFGHSCHVIEYDITVAHIADLKALKNSL